MYILMYIMWFVICRAMAFCGGNVRCAPLVDAYGCTYKIRRGVIKLDLTSFLTRLKVTPLFDAYECKAVDIVITELAFFWTR